MVILSFFLVRIIEIEEVIFFLDLLVIIFLDLILLIFLDVVLLIIFLDSVLLIIVVLDFLDKFLEFLEFVIEFFEILLEEDFEIGYLRRLDVWDIIELILGELGWV